MSSFSVIVGNVGTVFTGSEQTARREFNEYVKASRSSHCRASGEDVTLLNDRGDIEREFIGRLSKQTAKEESNHVD
jgi:hypothetical protein